MLSGPGAVMVANARTERSTAQGVRSGNELLRRDAPHGDLERSDGRIGVLASGQVLGTVSHWTVSVYSLVCGHVLCTMYLCVLCMSAMCRLTGQSEFRCRCSLQDQDDNER